ncbi:MAG: AAA family ATPase [Bacteroidales bacterium]|nr:AAA family ATPase [Bacteroidales bacterium]
MSTKPFIKKYSISNLFGYKNFELSFDDNIKILIGENGYGKTTVLNSLSFLLKGEYKNLSRIKFSEIRIEFDDSHNYEFSSNDLKSYVQYLDKQKEGEDGIISYINHRLEPSELTQLIKLVYTNKDEVIETIKNNDILNGIPSSIVYQALLELSERTNKYKVFTDIATYVNSTGYKILYYPTYRRVEVDLKNIMNNISHNTRRGFRNEQDELMNDNTIIKFGMSDVEKRRDKICEEIRRSSISGFAAVSGGMISKLLDQNFSNTECHNFDINEIKIVLSRVGENMSQNDKDTILSQISSDPSLNQQNSYLRYFLDQLLSVYKKQEKYDTAIKQFVKTCNNYLCDKEFSYDESAVDLKLHRKNNAIKPENLELIQLSSGEKQIVSIFSQLYLEPDKKYIVLFDEPELSLSIYWQEKLLPDMLDSGRCVFMLAVTHSPFIFNNDLKANVAGLKEFMKNGTEK